MSFLGYKRENGWYGTRNFVGIISLGSCTNDPARDIAEMVVGTVYLGQDTACQNGAADEVIYYRTMANIGKNPNLAAVLLVGPTCECINSSRIREEIETTGKRVEWVSIHDEGGVIGCIGRGMRLAQEMVSEVSRIQPEWADDKYLRLGLTCGGSTPLREVVPYGARPEGKGLFFIDAPGNDLACMLSLVAAGCNVISYSTESCCPYGVPFVPVIKVTCNDTHLEQYSDMLDYCVDTDMAVTDLDAAGAAFYQKVLSVASGEMTKNEIIKYYNTNRILNVNPMA